MTRISDNRNRAHSRCTESLSPFPGVSGIPTVPNQPQPSAAVYVEKASPYKEAESKRDSEYFTE